MKDIFSFLPDRVYLVLLIILFSLSVIATYHYNYGVENSIDWLITSNTDVQKVEVDSFQIGLFNFGIPGDNHLVWETFSATSMKINLKYLYLMLIAFVIGISLVHSAVSFLKRIPFVVGSVVLLFLVTTMHLEQAMSFGGTDRILVYVFIAVLLGVGFLFQSFFQNVSAIMRFLVFLLIYAVAAIVLNYTSTIDDPFIAIAPYVYNSAGILAVLFVVVVAQEVIYFILFLSGKTAGSINMNNGKHFLVISTLYLINLLLLYLRNASHIRVELSVLNELTILIISTIIAVYTLKEKKVIFGDDFVSWGYYLFAGLGIVFFGLLGSQAAMANDPVLDAIEEVISYAHLAFGTLFFLYIILNFLNPLLQNFQVHRIVYKEVNFPFVTSVLAGAVGVMAFFFGADKVPYLEYRSGYYNIHGDIQMVQGNTGLAEQYYEGGAVYGGANQKSYYQLATISAMRGNKVDFEGYMKNTFLKNPSDYTYVRLADFYKNEGDFFNSLFTLREGLQKFPESTSLRNNIAVMYTNMNVLDSALIYLDQDIFSEEWKDMSKSNSWYVLAKSNLNFSRDTLQQLILNESDPAVQSNYLGFANAKKIQLDLRGLKMFEDSILTNGKLSLLNNLVVNKAIIDFDIYDEIIERVNVGQNVDYYSVLDYDAVLASYNDGDYNTALRLLDKIQGASRTDKGHFLNLSGILAYKNGAYKVASEFFLRSLQAGDPTAALNYGLALSESDNIAEALAYWESIESTTNDTILAQVSYNLLNNLTMSLSEVMEADNDVLKFQYLKILGTKLGRDDFVQAWQTITDDQAKSAVLNDQIFDLLNKGQTDEALWFIRFAQENQVVVSSPSVREVAYLSNNVEYLSQLSTDTDPLYSLLSRDNLDSLALQDIVKFASKNPFDIGAILYAVNGLKEKGHVQMAYDILLSTSELNSYSIPLIKSFALTALEANFPNYGETALLQLYSLVDSEEYSTFAARYDELKREVESRDVWDF